MKMRDDSEMKEKGRLLNVNGNFGIENDRFKIKKELKKKKYELLNNQKTRKLQIILMKHCFEVTH